MFTMAKSKWTPDRMRRILAFGVALLSWSFAFFTQEARAVPELQIYVEGAAYDASSETWVLSSAGSFDLWVIGNTDAKGSIDDVKISAAVATAETGSITLTPTTTALLTDPSTPSAPTFIGLSADGAVPQLGDGSNLPTHGIYGPGTSFYEWSIGDFTLTDSPLADFSGPLYPTSFTADKAQINVYTVAVTGYTTVHFDAYDHYYNIKGDAKYVNAPFSHDGEGNVAPVPEPEIYAMMGLGLALLGFVGRRQRRGVAKS